MKSPMVTMPVKKIMRWGLLPLTLCAMTTVLLFSDITASVGEQPLAAFTIVIRYAAALLIGLVSEVCIHLVGWRLKKEGFYERIMKDKPSLLSWLKFFAVFGLFGISLPFFSLFFSLLFVVVIQFDNGDILYILRLSLSASLLAGFFISVILYPISIFYSRKKRNAITE
jgi:hypothetical protein